jgi:hypothetical protein
MQNTHEDIALAERGRKGTGYEHVRRVRKA